jgi:hypothetical protein
MRLGPTGLPAALTIRLWTAAAIAAILAWAIKLVTPVGQPVILAAVVLLPHGLVPGDDAGAPGTGSPWPTRSNKKT